MPRVVWKGAITFGLVHIPVTLVTGARDNDLSFDWLDKRDMSPVGYRRINKRSGEEMDAENIVKGYQYESGEYVLLSDEDFRAANPEATQTVDIVSFADVAQVPPYFFEKPYYLEPGKRGEKGYALLRETLRRTKRVGIAKVVMYRKQHLAVVMVYGGVLVLNTMRFAEEILPMDELNVPDEDLKKVGVTDRELEMAERLVDDMTEEWRAEQYRDTYRDDLMARIEAKIAAGETKVLTPVGDEPRRESAQVIDLMAMLRESLERKGQGSKAKPEPAAEESKPAPRRRAAEKKAPARATTKSAPKSAKRKAG